MFIQKFQASILFGASVPLLLSVLCSCARYERRLVWNELVPILKQNNLNAADPSDHHQEVREVEEVDSKLYGPLVGQTIFLESPAPTFDSRGLKPRYWLRVEDYQTAAMALKRASEYRAVDTYERIEKASGKDSFILSKTSVRIWAIARGRRVYALTTDTNLFTLIETPNSLRKAISLLPQI